MATVKTKQVNQLYYAVKSDDDKTVKRVSKAIEQGIAAIRATYIEDVHRVPGNVDLIEQLINTARTGNSFSWGLASTEAGALAKL